MEENVDVLEETADNLAESTPEEVADEIEDEVEEDGLTADELNAVNNAAEAAEDGDMATAEEEIETAVEGMEE